MKVAAIETVSVSFFISTRKSEGNVVFRSWQVSNKTLLELAPVKIVFWTFGAGLFKIHLR